MDAKEVIKRLQSLVKVNSPSKVPEAVRDLLNNSHQHNRTLSLNDQTKDSRELGRNVNPERSASAEGVESIDFEYEVRQPADAGTNHKQNVLVLPEPADVNNKYFSFGGGAPEYGGDVAIAGQNNPYAS